MPRQKLLHAHGKLTQLHTHAEVSPLVVVVVVMMMVVVVVVVVVMRNCDTLLVNVTSILNV